MTIRTANQRCLPLLLAAALFGGLSACGGDNGGGAPTEPTLKIGTPLAEAVDANGQPVALEVQDVVQPTITLTD